MQQTNFYSVGSFEDIEFNIFITYKLSHLKLTSL